MKNEDYVRQSLELNIFFLRIMKEHGLFLAVSFPPKNQDFIREASDFNANFHNLLKTAVELANGVVEFRADAITEYTIPAEEKTEELTGFQIDTSLTETELKTPKPGVNLDLNFIGKVSNLNNRALAATKNFIRYKTKVYNALNACQLFSTNYHLLVEHIRREAIYYVELLTKLEKHSLEDNLNQKVLEEEFFWNEIMNEHMQFIRGYLDPTETNLINLANDFSKQYSALNEKIQTFGNNQLNILNDSQKLTKELKKFKAQGTSGLIECKVKAIAVPLLGDHVLREANHYLYLLENYKKLARQS
ncbi:MAG: DUF2935 domain-containing protein [Bacilli bacterium]|nr:DUF2935 domain-containing protein [Bacilli bacterium]